MKKTVKILTVAAIGLLLTGCGAKKMTCTYSVSDSYSGKKTEKVTYEFSKDGEKLNKVTAVYSKSYSKKYLKYMDEENDKTISDILDAAQDKCDDYEGDIVKCTAKKKGNTITQTITYNLKDVSKKDLERMYEDEDISSSTYYSALSYVKTDYEDMKKNAKDPGYEYTCK